VTTPMPNVARWANELRAVFGVDEFNEGLRRYGYMASEGGRTIDTRSQRPMREVSLADMVVIKTPHPASAGKGSAR
jgi:hypothetical protein